MTRLAVIGDIHGNFPALEAVVAAVRGRVDGWICTGDIAGHLPMVDEVVTMLRRLDAICVCGNHDHALVAGLPIRNSSAATRALQIQRRLVTASTRSWLAALPEHIELAIDGRQIAIRHGGPYDPLEGKVHVVDEAVRAFAAGRILILGNTHRPVVDVGHGHAVLNPGAVGLPVTGDRRAQAMILDVATCTVEEIRVEYDPRPVESRMRALGYDERYFNCLASGRWMGFVGDAPPARIIIAGAGVYGEMVAELVRARPEMELAGFVDDRVADSFADAPVLGTIDRLMEIADAEAAVDVAVAIGDNGSRRRLADRIWRAGVRPARLVHPTATVSPTAQLGFGCIVDAGAYIGPHCVLQDGVSVWPRVVLSHHTRVGAYASLKPGAIIGGGSRIAAEEKLALGSVWPAYSTIGDAAADQSQGGP